MVFKIVVCKNNAGLTIQNANKGMGITKEIL